MQSVVFSTKKGINHLNRILTSTHLIKNISLIIINSSHNSPNKTLKFNSKYRNNQYNNNTSLLNSSKYSTKINNNNNNSHYSNNNSHYSNNNSRHSSNNNKFPKLFKIINKKIHNNRHRLLHRVVAISRNNRLNKDKRKLLKREKDLDYQLYLKTNKLYNQLVVIKLNQYNNRLYLNNKQLLYL